jgi:hypothetical protein
MEQVPRYAATLNLAAAAWGLVNFGLLLWLPADLRARGYSVSGSNELLFYSTMIVAWFDSKWSTNGRCSFSSCSPPSRFWARN